MKRQNRQFTKFISLLKFPGLQYLGLVSAVKGKLHSKIIISDPVDYIL